MKTKQAREKYYTRDRVEAAVRKHVEAIYKIRGAVSVDVKAVIRVADKTDPNKAVVVLVKRA